MSTNKRRRNNTTTARKTRAKSKTLRNQRLIGRILLGAIGCILLFIVFNLLRPNQSGPLNPPQAKPATVATSHENPVTGNTSLASANNTSAKKAKYDFYSQLKKRNEEVEQEVKHRIETEKPPEIEGRNYRIQVGAFQEIDLANRLRARMILRDYPVQLIQNGEIHMVQIGPYQDRDEAISVQKRLEREGVKTLLKAYVN